jgi:hypothetical protein
MVRGYRTHDFGFMGLLDFLGYTLSSITKKGKRKGERKRKHCPSVLCFPMKERGN